MGAVKGVDISEMNGPVDFAALKRAGVQFVIIRCGYGSDYPGQQDTEFEANVRKAEAAKVPWGVYHYAYATSAAGGKAEAAHALRLIGNRKPAYGVWYDMEDGSTIGGDLSGAAEAFCSAVKAKGLHAGVYANLNWWENYLTSPVFDHFDRWCAQYNDHCQMRKPYSMWQFTDRLVIGGKNFDGNWDYKIHEEKDDMTEAQVRKIAQEEFRKVEPTYNTLEQVPSWWRTEIEHLIKIGLIKGTGNGNLGLTYTRAWTGVLIYRAMKVIADEDPIYRTIDDIPAWGRPAVQALIDSGKLSGEKIEADGNRILNLPRSDVRMIVAFLSNYIEDTGDGEREE